MTIQKNQAFTRGYKKHRLNITNLFFDYFSAYIPRTQRTDRTERNALSVHEPGNTTSLSGNLTRSTSLRTPRIRNDEIEESSIDFRRDRDKDKEKDKGMKLSI